MTHDFIGFDDRNDLSALYWDRCVAISPLFHLVERLPSRWRNHDVVDGWRDSIHDAIFSVDVYGCRCQSV